MHLVRLTVGIALLAGGSSLRLFAATVEEKPIDAQELAEELGFKTRKYIFSFEQPVYARVDFVHIDGGQPVHNPMKMNQPQRQVEFEYIMHGADPEYETIGLRLAQQTVKNRFKAIWSPSARPQNAYPKVVLPEPVSATIPVYLFLHWDPTKDGTIDFRMPPQELASKITRGYYLALYFSLTPFPN